MGRAKLLLPYEGRTLLEHAVGAALGSGAGLTVVVLGADAPAAQALLAAAWPGRRDLLAVTNPDYLAGQAGSLRLGLRALLGATAAQDAAAALGGPDAVVFCLGDQPRVTAETIGALIEAYLCFPAAPGQPRPLIVAPVHAGRRGNPVLIDRRLYPELLGLRGDTGARPVLARHAGEGETLLVPAGPEVLFDVDTPADYEDLGPGGAGPTTSPGGSAACRRPGSATS